MAQQDSRRLEKTATPGIYRKGNAYIVRWRDRGKSHKRSFRTMAEAKEHKRTLHGAGTQPTSNVRVGDYWQPWLAGYRGRTRRGAIEQSTRLEYASSFERHIAPLSIGRTKLRDLTSRDIDQWMTELEQAGAKPPTIAKDKAALSAMLASAAQAGDIASNPCTGVRFVPSRATTSTPRRQLTVADVQAILDAAEPQWRPLFQLLAETGLRIGEATGLTWRNVHLGDDPHVEVVEQMYKGRRKKLKTSSAARTIPLSAGMARVLAERRGHLEMPVFPSGAGTALSYGNVYTRLLQPTLERCGLDGQGIGFHSFRRFCGSMLTENMGRSITQVSQWLGHSDVAITFASYQHLTDKGLGGADEFGELWGHPGATDHPQTAADQEASEG